MYREKIAKLAPGYDPAHVEAYIRLANHPVTLDAMTPGHLQSEVVIACHAIDDHGLELSDLAAQCFGLKPRKRAS